MPSGDWIRARTPPGRPSNILIPLLIHPTYHAVTQGGAQARRAAPLSGPAARPSLGAGRPGNQSLGSAEEDPWAGIQPPDIDRPPQLVVGRPHSRLKVASKLARMGRRTSRPGRPGAETALTFGFHHLSEYFNEDPAQALSEEPFRSLLDLQRVGRLKPTAPVFIDINRFDPLVPWTSANQLGRDWCAQGADVQFWTNEQPPFLNKLDVNHALTYLVDDERSMQWIADRFNGLPTTPNCGEF